MNGETTHQQKLDWMSKWCAKNQIALDLEGNCGFGRECVGIIKDGKYPDYEWYCDQSYNRLDENGDVWTPDDAYHKHECVAVLGRGEKAESQLYEWLRWFEDNGFVAESGAQPVDPSLGALAYMLGKHIYVRMVRRKEAAA